MNIQLLRMKIILIALFPISLFGQAAIERGAFNQRLDVQAFRGKNFKLEAAVRLQPKDSAAEAEIWVRVDRANKKNGFFYNMMDKPIKTQQWQTFSIAGKIDEDADYLAFGGIYGSKGIFYF